MPKPVISLQRITLFSILFTFMVILHWIDAWIAFPVGGFPLKIGLANLIIVFVLFYFGPKETMLLIALKIITLAFFVPRYTAFTTLISLTGTLLSFAGMWVAKKYLKQNIRLTSMLGGILHNVGQWAMVLMITQVIEFIYYFPFLLLTGTLSGYFIGYINFRLMPRLIFLKKKHGL